MDSMKGQGKVVMQCDTDLCRIELVRFSDASLAIRRDGRAIGVWEPPEEEECLAVLAQLVGLSEGPETVLIVSASGLLGVAKASLAIRAALN